MSIARVTQDGLEIEYTDSKSGITVLHKISEKEGDPVVEDYYKGKDGNFQRKEIGTNEPEPAADPAESGTGEELRILGFRFNKK